MTMQFVAIPELPVVFTSIKQAEKYVGGVGNASKTWGKTFGINPDNCPTGRKFRDIIGTSCHGCYGFKGSYKQYAKTILIAWERRLNSLFKPQWVDAFIKVMTTQTLFRWHDVGDIQNIIHLNNILKVADGSPETKHWLPTIEHKVIRTMLKSRDIPSNIAIRLSTPKVNGKPVTVINPHTGNKVLTSGVYITIEQATATNAFICPVTMDKKLKTCKAANCKACWNTSVQHIAYIKH